MVDDADFLIQYHSEYKNHMKRTTWNESRNADRINAWLTDKGNTQILLVFFLLVDVGGTMSKQIGRHMGDSFYWRWFVSRDILFSFICRLF